MFPCWKYHPDGRKLKVQTPEHLEALKLGPEWANKPFPVIEKPEVPAECPNCERMNLSFNKSWDELTTAHRELQGQHQELTQKFGDLTAAHEKLTLENELLQKELAAAKAPQAQPEVLPAQQETQAPPPPPPQPDSRPKKSK